MILPQLVAHRGYPRHYPENTLIGLEAAIAAGARYIEVDVQVSRDRVPVLFHDRNLKRLCGVGGAVHDHVYEELWRLRIAEPDRFGERFRDVHITRLSELGHLLVRQPEVTAFVELKRASLERFGIDTLLTLARRSLKPVLGQCVLISYSLEALRMAHAKGWPRIGAVIDHWNEHEQKLVTDMRPDYIFCDVEGLPGDGDLGIDDAQLVVFEVADARLALSLAARGAKFIETFAIGEMIREISRLAATP
ncbi:MAG: glycerophosphodiester phosphodiesterase family protein [Gammaproteobacteria bacterium]|nr:glycerophosphodiester phosphodiesterase family protein [Gammaproteobacteria bacterium]